VQDRKQLSVGTAVLTVCWDLNIVASLLAHPICGGNYDVPEIETNLNFSPVSSSSILLTPSPQSTSSAQTKSQNHRITE